jgi:hypothetical protein
VAKREEFPELVYQKSHGPGIHDEHSFEDALRDLVRNSPYLGISLLLHGVVLAIFMSMKTPPIDQDLKNKIVASQEDIEEPIPPEPEEEPEIEEIDEIIEEPVISEEVVTEVTEVVDTQVDAAFESTGANDVIGVGGGGGGFGGRGKGRSRGKAAGAPHQKTVDDALMWLKNHQSPDGYWSAEGFEEECGKQGDGYCGGRGSVHHDIGVTGLSLLAFLGANNTDKKGKYRDTVKAGLRYLLDVQDRNGNFATNDIATNTYDHFLATLAVVEAYALTGHHRYKKAAESAMDYAYSLRNPARAWRYSNPSDPDMITHPDDVSVTGWAIMAMTMAKDYEMEIDDVALEDSLLFIDEMTDGLGRTGYYEPGGGSSRALGREDDFPYEDTEAMTAVGILCRIFADPDMERVDIQNEADIEAGVKLLLDLPIVWDEDNEPGKIDFYYWYYATYALYQWGGKDWRAWEAGIPRVAEMQIPEGEAKGSWDPQVDAWGGEGGRVYATATLALMMEVYYRYDSVLGSH